MYDAMICHSGARARMVSETTASAQSVGPEGMDWRVE